MRRRFVLVSLAVTAMMFLGFAVPLAVLVRGMITNNTVHEAELQAAAIASVLTATTRARPVEQAIRSTRFGQRGRIVVHLPDGSHLGGGVGWVNHRRLDQVGDKPDILDVPDGKVHLRPALLPGDQTAVIEVFIPMDRVNHRVMVVWVVLGAAGGVMLIVSALLADRLASSAVQATRRLAGAAIRLGEGDLGVRVHPSGPPEIATVGMAFNLLADRFQVLLANERELIADLSHRLRTPLTALRLNAESISAEETRHRVLAAAENLEREVDGIIQQARRPLTLRHPARCDLVEVVRERMRTWSALADDQDRHWVLDAPSQPVWVSVAESDVAAAVDAIVGNVFRHTPEGAPYQVRIQRIRDFVVLSVDDGGPGIAQPELALRRGASGGASTGLGTDIARRVAESAGGGIQIERSRLGGASVSLTLRVTPLLTFPSSRTRSDKAPEA